MYISCRRLGRYPRLNNIFIPSLVAVTLKSFNNHNNNLNKVSVIVILPFNEMAPQTPTRRPRVPTIPKARPKPTPRRKVCFNDLKQKRALIVLQVSQLTPSTLPVNTASSSTNPRQMSITILLPQLPHSLITMFMLVLVCFPMNPTPIHLMNPTLTLQIQFQPIRPLLLMLDRTLLYLPPITLLLLTWPRFLIARSHHLLPNLVAIQCLQLQHGMPPTAPSPLGQHRFPTSTLAGFHVSHGGSAGHDDTYLDSDPDPDPEFDYDQGDDFGGSDTATRSGIHEEEEDQEQEQWPQFHQHDQSIDPHLSSQQIQASS